MNKFTLLCLTSVLGLGVSACGDVARTSTSAPDSINEVGNPPDLDTVLKNKSDATNPTRRAQANADIRAREQRYNLFREGEERCNRNVQSEVRSKLEVNLPTSQLAIQANQGIVTITGYVQTQENLERIEPLAREIRGVRDVNVQAEVGPNLPPYNS
ncbi:Putative phospholipid-binding domain family [Coleofasciculus chthonoplastes PCC 7420]|uniref:Putative phospholipid-binding domain family n=1 Tax=Coleofasciculus chthonoplastes PCC 7420 TaxID=118168 RepID=B4VSD1_9CYAN|nr:BON domain-containing protein [Coleofasciculus chthonoplastes]EDX75058.1 Putative phospholipid-binding domain family [Coleofasciculus chthonoplastes PCC 7420]